NLADAGAGRPSLILLGLVLGAAIGWYHLVLKKRGWQPSTSDIVLSYFERGSIGSPPILGTAVAASEANGTIEVIVVKPNGLPLHGSATRSPNFFWHIKWSERSAFRSVTCGRKSCRCGRRERGQEKWKPVFRQAARQKKGAT